MKNLTYYIRKNNNPLSQNDFEQLISTINEMEGVGILQDNDHKNVSTIIYEKLPMKPLLTFTPEETTLKTQLTDNTTVIMLRTASHLQKIKLFSVDLECYLPTDPYLLLVANMQLNENVERAFNKKGLKPIFVLQNSNIFYAQDEDNAVHIVNEHLINHFINFNTYDSLDEFNYQVADNMQMFVSKYDVGLIPDNFYKYYKKPQKIINYSNFNLENPGRKVFVKPYIYELESPEKGFTKYSSEEGTSIFADKIRKGENLDSTIRRVLKEHLSLANDYIGARVLYKLEFDRDRNQILIPRLLVEVYVGEEHLTERFKSKKDRQWRTRDEIKFS